MNMNGSVGTTPTSIGIFGASNEISLSTIFLPDLFPKENWLIYVQMYAIARIPMHTISYACFYTNNTNSNNNNNLESSLSSLSSMLIVSIIGIYI